MLIIKELPPSVVVDDVVGFGSDEVEGVFGVEELVNTVRKRKKNGEIDKSN